MRIKFFILVFASVLMTTMFLSSSMLAQVGLKNTAANAFTLLSAASANLTSVTDGATTVYGLHLSNINAAAVYIKLFNKASAPDPSACSSNSDCPVITLLVPGATTGVTRDVIFPTGLSFSTGLGLAIVTGAAATNETAVSANEVLVNIDYKH